MSWSTKGHLLLFVHGLHWRDIFFLVGLYKPSFDHMRILTDHEWMSYVCPVLNVKRSRKQDEQPSGNIPSLVGFQKKKKVVSLMSHGIICNQWFISFSSLSCIRLPLNRKRGKLFVLWRTELCLSYQYDFMFSLKLPYELPSKK